MNKQLQWVSCFILDLYNFCLRYKLIVRVNNLLASTDCICTLTEPLYAPRAPYSPGKSGKDWSDWTVYLCKAQLVHIFVYSLERYITATVLILINAPAIINAPCLFSKNNITCINLHKLFLLYCIINVAL